VSPHEAFLKAIRVNPNDPWHAQVYGDFLLDEGYDPPDEYIRQATHLADLLHSAKRSFRPPSIPLGAFGLELLLNCRHLRAMRELYLAGRQVVGGRYGNSVRVEANIGEQGVIRLVHAPLIEQITHLDIRFNNLGEEAFQALANAPGLVPCP
jgi:hypothetical protein